MATHSSIPAWEIPRTEELGGLQPMRLQKSWTQNRGMALNFLKKSPSPGKELYLAIEWVLSFPRILTIQSIFKIHIDYPKSQ